MADSARRDSEGSLTLNIAIVGASGFVGQSVARAARLAGHHVTEAEAPRFRTDARGLVGLRSELETLASQVEALTQKFRGKVTVINCAGLAEPGALMTADLVGANSLLPGLVVRAAIAAGVRRVVHVSSAAVYGDAEVLSSRVEPKPLSSYGVSKLWGEELAESEAQDRDVELIVYRPTSVHGAGRRVTEQVRRLARSRLSSVAGRGEAPTPQTTIEGVSTFLVDLATTENPPNVPVVHPWEGWTTASFLEYMGDGRRPWHIPATVARLVLRLAKLAGRLHPTIYVNSRRLELLWFGQQVESDKASPPGRKIVIATTVDKSLGLLTDFPERLVARGWEVHLVSSGGPRLSRFAEATGVNAHVITMARNPRPASDIVSLARWVSLLRRLRPDVAYLGTPKASLLGMLAARAVRVPVRVYLIRGLRAETATGKRAKLLLCLERLTMACATEVLSVSSSLAGRVRDLTGRSTRVVGVGTSNGIDLDQYRRRLPDDNHSSLRSELGLSNGTYVLGFVGRITEDKGVGDALSALSILLSEGWDVRLLLVGTREEPMSFEAQLDALSAFVIEVGETNSPESYLEMMDVFLMPSRREGFSNAILEAAAMGVPIVASNSTGIIDFVKDNVTGLLVESGRPDQIVEAVKAINRDEILRSRLRSSAQVAVSQFERTMVQDRYIDHLANLAEERSTRQFG